MELTNIEISKYNKIIRSELSYINVLSKIDKNKLFNKELTLSDYHVHKYQFKILSNLLHVIWCYINKSNKRVRNFGSYSNQYFKSSVLSQLNSDLKSYIIKNKIILKDIISHNHYNFKLDKMMEELMNE